MVISRPHPTHFDWSGPGVGGLVRRVVEAATESDGRSPLNEAALLALRHEGLSSSSLWVATPSEGEGSGGSDASGDGAGFALADAPPGADGHVEVNLVVDPAFRGKGVGRALATAVLDAFPDATISAWSHGNHPAAAALASTLGLTRARDLWVMRRSMAGDLPAVETPAGVVVRTFEPGRDEDAFLAVNAEAFLDHPEQGGMTRADLEQRMAEPWFDPAGFFLAERSDAPAGGAAVESPSLLGFHWTKVHPATDAGEPAYGEVYVVGVSPAAQGLGLGKVLTLTGLRHLEQQGLAEVILYVESDNAPAVAVYSGLGFTHADEDTDVMYRRPVSR